MELQLDPMTELAVVFDDTIEVEDVYHGATSVVSDGGYLESDVTVCGRRFDPLHDELGTRQEWEHEGFGQCPECYDSE